MGQETNDNQVKPIAAKDILDFLKKIRLMENNEDYFSQGEIMDALNLLYKERETTFRVREAFDMQHQLERIATALERIADSYVEGVSISHDPEHYQPLILKQQCSGDCGMNYCDDNGCIERKRVLTDPATAVQEGGVGA